MKVVFEMDVSMMALPLSPPTKENCGKCCISRGNRRICDTAKTYNVCDWGRKGYFVLNGMTGTHD
jgi:hypothetical protein